MLARAFVAEEAVTSFLCQHMVAISLLPIYCKTALAIATVWIVKGLRGEFSDIHYTHALHYRHIYIRL